VTHEFKTPLTSIKAYLDLLEMYPDDDELLETAQTNIKSETERLYEMVDKVLQLSTLEKYDFEYNPEKIEIKQITSSVLQSLSGKMNKFGIKLEAELTEAYVNADKDSIIIILVNLLDNAIKYNKIDGKIFVKNYIHEEQVYIEIIDTGIGIPKEAVTRVFEPFYTVDKNRSRQSGGAGLGLSLVKKYIDKQGGSIKLINSDDNGTTFRISFPEA
jgi:signal transduction histidine kinase